jgi:hypothetical protein
VNPFIDWRLRVMAEHKRPSERVDYNAGKPSQYSDLSV